MRSFLRNRRFKNFASKIDVLCFCLLLNSKCSAFTNTLTKNNTDKIDIELPSSRKVSSPFILIILNWVTGKCDIILGAYRNKDYEQVPVIAVDTTGEATISFTDGILTLKFTKRHSCLVAYY